QIAQARPAATPPVEEHEVDVGGRTADLVDEGAAAMLEALDRWGVRSPHDARRLAAGPLATRRAIASAFRGPVEAALRLLAPAPAAGPGIFAWPDLARAGDAADARIVLIVQRIVRHLVLAHVRPHVVHRPPDERVHLDEAEPRIPADDRRGRPLG